MISATTSPTTTSTNPQALPGHVRHNQHAATGSATGDGSPDGDCR
jgi:hypothetical protein